MMRIHTKALALSVGIVCGLIVLVKTLLGVFIGYGSEHLAMLVSVYPGYSVTVVGAVIGALYGFLNGAVIAGVIGWIYNRLFVRM